jgi:hypothetical protein
MARQQSAEYYLFGIGGGDRALQPVVGQVMRLQAPFATRAWSLCAIHGSCASSQASAICAGVALWRVPDQAEEIDHALIRRKSGRCEAG